MTNPKRTARARSPAEAVQMISELLDSPGLQILPTPAEAVTGLIGLLKRHPATGGEIFDLQIIATMLTNGIQRISTFNVKDFLSSSSLRSLPFKREIENYAGKRERSALVI